MGLNLFDSDQVPIELLQRRAFNYRWAEVDKDVIPLTAADPDFAVAKEIREAISDYALEGVFSYGPKLGLPELKIATQRYFLHRGYQALEPDLILPIDSAASGLQAVANAVLSAGDEVILLDPIDYLFRTTCASVGAKAISCPFDYEKKAFDFDKLDSLVTSKTRAIGVCNPSNPLGRILTTGELEKILDIAERHNLTIINDEIWSDIVYKPHRFCSFNQLDSAKRRRVVTVYGFSKAYGLAGLRVGVVYTTNEEIYTRVVKSSGVESTVGGVSMLSQIAATTALEKCGYWKDAFVEHLSQMRNLAVERLNSIAGFRCELPQATYLLFVNVTGTGMTEIEVADYLHSKGRVAIVPGIKDFFGENAIGHIRICYATSQSILSNGLDRMSSAFSHVMGNTREIVS